MPPNRRLGIVCDVGPEVGAGHIMRCAALSEEFIREGWSVHFACDPRSVPIAADRLRQLGASVEKLGDNSGAHTNWMRTRGISAVLVDSYKLAPEISKEIALARPTLAFIDGSTRGQSAAIYVDQNFGAQDLTWDPHEYLSYEPVLLSGVKFAVIRDDIRRLRPLTAPGGRGPRTLTSPGESKLQLCVVMGGTDPLNIASRVSAQLAELPLELGVTVVSPHLTHRALADISRGSPSTFKLIKPTPRLAQILAASDLVITAAGSTTWELCCLGKAMALAITADNQTSTYASLIEADIACGLGQFHRSNGGNTSVGDPLGLGSMLAEFATNGSWRSELAARAYSLVDGNGKRRIYETFVAVMDTHTNQT